MRLLTRKILSWGGGGGGETRPLTLETVQVSLSFQVLQTSQIGHMVVLDMAPPLQISSLHSTYHSSS
jgi:hypothetical protein